MVTSFLSGYRFLKQFFFFLIPNAPTSRKHFYSSHLNICEYTPLCECTVFAVISRQETELPLQIISMKSPFNLVEVTATYECWESISLSHLWFEYIISVGGISVICKSFNYRAKMRIFHYIVDFGWTKSLMYSIAMRVFYRSSCFILYSNVKPD